MNRRLLIVLLLLVGLPLALLIGMGRRVARGEQERLERRIEALIADRLQSVDARLQTFIADSARHLLGLTSDLPSDPDAIRDLTRRDARISSFFRLAPDGDLLYPVASATRPLAGAEADFLRRTALLWRNRELWHITGGAPEARPESPAFASSAPPPDHGWHPWHFEHGLHLLFWRRLASGEIVGAELDRARLMGDLLAILPDTEAAADVERTVLLNADGQALYQWGAYEPADDELPRVSLQVSPPLGSWRLAWYGRPEPRPQSAVLAGFTAWGGIAALAISLALLALYFYRESSREMRDAAQRVNFVGQVSHELKTPLTNIRLYAELLEQQLGDADDEARKDLHVIVSESRRLSRLIGNILTFSRKNREALRLRPAPADLDAALRDTVETFRPLLESRGMKIDLHLAAGEAVFDRDVLEQIVGNLLSNVEKYGAASPHGTGRLTVTSRRHNGGSLVLVADQGPGVPRAEREKIFQPFYRVSDRLTDGVAGTGLGLSLSRDLARLHGGDLRLVDAPGGATFELTLADLSPKGAPA